MSDPLGPHIQGPHIHVRAVQLSGWRAVAATVTGLAVLAVLATLLALGFLLLVVPALAVGSVAYYLMSKPARRTVSDLKGTDRAGNATIIDATYQVKNDAAGDNRDGQE